jgi:hypothetical protein
VADQVRGAQVPRVCSVPPFVSSAGQEAVELARMAGLELDPWQEFVLERSLGERADGKWAAFEVGLCVPRQNGKGSVEEARELAGLFLLGERLLIHSAHQFDTSLEAFRRLLMLIESCPDFDRRVKRVSRAHGEEGIELLSGQRIRFRTRTKGGGRGFAADLLVLDEAMILGAAMHGALLPTLSAMPNPQVWYAGSAVDQLVHEHGVVFARVRERGVAGDDPSLAYFEWSVDAPSPADVSFVELSDQVSWATANPALGIRVLPEHVEHELRSMDRRTFAVERLGVGDWPRVDGAPEAEIPVGRWNALTDPASRMVDPVALCFDVSPDRSVSSICAAGWRADGLAHVEVVDRRRGTSWVASRLAELVGSHQPVGVAYDGAGPAASLAHEIAELGVTAEPVTAAEHAQSCGRLVDRVTDGTLRHLGTTELEQAVKAGTKRPLGDAWAWSRKTSSADITPLVGVTLALGALETHKKPSAWRPL